MLDVITRRSNLELMLQIGAEILVSEDPRHRGDHPDLYYVSPGLDWSELDIYISGIF